MYVYVQHTYVHLFTNWFVVTESPDFEWRVVVGRKQRE